MSSSPTETGALVDVTMPQMGVSVAEGTVVSWRVTAGEPIRADETICEISTDKIDIEVPAPASGIVTEILVEPERTVTVGTVLARIATGSGGSGASELETASPVHGGAANGAPAPGTVPPQGTVPAATAGGGRRRYSPVVQRIAALHGIDLARVSGTGRDGRVRKQDVLAAVAAPPVAASSEDNTEPPLHTESPYVAGTERAAAGVSGGLSRMRRQIGEHMKRSLHTAATCTTWIEVDMGRVQAARARSGLTALPFVAQATVAALREHPSLNAWLEDDRYTRHDTAVHLGIAVSLGDGGLIVPVIHNAHELSVEGLAARITRSRPACARGHADARRGHAVARSRSPTRASTDRSWRRRSSTSRRSRSSTSRRSSSGRSSSPTRRATTASPSDR